MDADIKELCERVVALLFSKSDLSLQEIARSVGTDRHKIEQAVTGQYGFCFCELKKRARLNRALKLLREEQPVRYVKEIAAELGITPNALSRLVKSMTGRCPTDLRNQK